MAVMNAVVSLAFRVAAFLWDVFVRKTGAIHLATWMAKLTGRALLYAAYLAFVFGLAVFGYLCFYYMYIPTVSHVHPVYLQFRDSKTTDSFASTFHLDASFTSSLHSDSQDERSSKHHQDLASSTHLSIHHPYSAVTLTESYRLLTKGQGYDVSMVLELPESDVNRQLGMFMVAADFYSSEGHLVRRSSRPAILRYQSELLRTMSTLFYALPLLFGLVEQRQVLHIPLFEEMIDSSDHPITRVIASLSKADIQIYSAVLRIDAHFTGLRYLMYWWPVTTGTIGVLWNYVVLLAGFYLIRRRYNLDEFLNDELFGLAPASSSTMDDDLDEGIFDTSSPYARFGRPFNQNANTFNLGGNGESNTSVIGSGPNDDSMLGNASNNSSILVRPLEDNNASVLDSPVPRIVEENQRQLQELEDSLGASLGAVEREPSEGEGVGDDDFENGAVRSDFHTSPPDSPLRADL